MTAEGKDPSSFRDPSGFLFGRDGRLYRQVNENYRDDYDLLNSSGLYKALVEGGLLISHKESDAEPASSSEAYKVIEPSFVPFISYPYEWCFSQLQDAALLTLQLQMTALEHGMSLKDASAYNIQFVAGRPILIDTLSFEQYIEGEPWVAYKQFCQHFLAPLALMSFVDVRLSRLLTLYIDGVPLDLAASLLPMRTKFKAGLAAHIHLHARSQRHYAERTTRETSRKFRLRSLMGLVESLKSAVRGLRWRLPHTEWGDYYDLTNYTEAGFQHKQQVVRQLLTDIEPKSVWDLGANNGAFSRIAAEHAESVIAFDIDPVAVEENYLQCRKEGETRITPLLIDLTNPSPAIGWANRERMPLPERGIADVALALALVHHLAISDNLPLGMIADWMASLCRDLIIEFVPKADSQVQRLLSTREDIFADYHQERFEREFSAYFDIVEKSPIRETERTVYRMRRI
jgi:ribosomal protein L11 methylase PrmA